MWAGTEFIVGGVVLAVGMVCVGIAVTRGRAWRRAAMWTAVVVDLAVISTLFMDWGYSWVDEIALDIALQSNVWIALPHAIACVTLLSFGLWGRHALPWAVLLAAMQGFSFIPVMFFVGLDTDTSYLAGPPMAGMYLSILAAFLFLPEASAVIPPASSRWHAVAFGPRTRLIESIAGLSALGLRTRNPGTVFESGSASGTVSGIDVEVDTVPALLPPAYALRIRWKPPWGSKAGVDPGNPGFTKRESVRAGTDSIEYVGLSKDGFDVSSESLGELIMNVSSSLRDSR